MHILRHQDTERVGGDIGVPIHRRNAVLGMRRDREPRVGHAPRHKNPLLQEILERLT